MNELNMDTVTIISIVMVVLTIVSFLGFALAKYLQKN
jgi:phage shock protein PspC (stress-responsive transcriptional regulator)